METTRRNAWVNLPGILLAILLLAPIVTLPDTIAWREGRVFTIQAVAFGLMALWVARVNWSKVALQKLAVTGPNLAIVLLVGWSVLSFTLTAHGTERGQGLALEELLRIASGAALYFGILYACCSRPHLRWVSLLLLTTAIFAGLTITFYLLAFTLTPVTFGQKQLTSALLAIMLPLATAFALPDQLKSRRGLALAALPLLLCALLLSCNRSSWAGGAIGVVVVVVLARRAGLLRSKPLGSPKLRKRYWLVPLLGGLALLGLMLVNPRPLQRVLGRTKTLTSLAEDSTLQWRLRVWAASGRVLVKRPLTGWGIGSFPLVISDFSKEVPSKSQVEWQGASLSSLAHNEYVQTAAELGLVGLTLYLAVLIGFFRQGLRALGALGGTRKWLLLGTMGGVAAQCVDAVGNPAWRFSNISPFLWLLLGIGMASARRGPDVCMESRPHVNKPGWPLYLQRVAAVTGFVFLLMVMPHGPVHAFWIIKVPGASYRTHQEITADAILGENHTGGADQQFFGVPTPVPSMEDAAFDIEEADRHVDEDQFTSAKHFDGENFTGGQALVVGWRHSLIVAIQGDRADEARAGLGTALHTLQDFYAHSNWVEYLMDNRLGLMLHPDVGKPGHPVENWFPPVAGPNTPTCNGSLLLVSYVPLLTSGYYGGEDRVAPLGPAGVNIKCRHGGNIIVTKDTSPGGGGINKDSTFESGSPHNYYHSQAALLAMVATRQFITELRDPRFAETITYRQLGQLLGAVATDVTNRVNVTFSAIRYDRKSGHYFRRATISNQGNRRISGPMALVLYNLSSGAAVVNRSGFTSFLEHAAPLHSPYIQTPDGLEPPDPEVGFSATITMEFANIDDAKSFSAKVFAGPGGF